jgi:hypothetical protein
VSLYSTYLNCSWPVPIVVGPRECPQSRGRADCCISSAFTFSHMSPILVDAPGYPSAKTSHCLSSQVPPHPVTLSALPLFRSITLYPFQFTNCVSSVNGRHKCSRNTSSLRRCLTDDLGGPHVPYTRPVDPFPLRRVCPLSSRSLPLRNGPPVSRWLCPNCENVVMEWHSLVT